MTRSKRRHRSGIVIPWERGGAVWGFLRGRLVRNFALVGATVFAFWWIFGHDDHLSRVRETRSAIAQLSKAVGSFRADNGRCPTSLGEVARPSDAAGAYVREVPRDGWGHRFSMICPGRRNPDSADIRSMGPDGTWFEMDEID